MRELALTKGQVALVDDDDWEVLSRHKWCAHWSASSSSYYADSTQRGLLHRWILAAPSGLFVDHINGNTLDNRRSNLRLATRSQNQANTRRSPNQQRGLYKGVSWDSESGKWKASLRLNGKQVNIGRFRHPEEAALAYDAFARSSFGEFACCNYPDES